MEINRKKIVTFNLRKTAIQEKILFAMNKNYKKYFNVEDKLFWPIYNVFFPNSNVILHEIYNIYFQKSRNTNEK